MSIHVLDTRCPFCHRDGFVHVETVIAKGRSHRHYFCEACNRTWPIRSDDPKPPADPSDPLPKKPPRQSGD